MDSFLSCLLWLQVNKSPETTHGRDALNSITNLCINCCFPDRSQSTYLHSSITLLYPVHWHLGSSLSSDYTVHAKQNTRITIFFPTCSRSHEEPGCCSEPAGHQGEFFSSLPWKQDLRKLSVAMSKQTVNFQSAPSLPSPWFMEYQGEGLKKKKMFREIGIRIWGEGEEKRGFRGKS